ncbi:MAG: amidohydrolase family protein, partial [Bacteroidota bacterium]|nr:amidohydrolase family protein [Bacteroidota bacterium]
MKIDAHQHFWKYNSAEYAWISDSMRVLKRDFLPEDLRKELKTIGFEGSVAVQARQTTDETRWLLGLAEEFDFIKGVVGWIDLCYPEAEDQLAEFSSHAKFTGVRHVLQDEPDDQFMLRDSFLKGISLLVKFNLVYEILIFTRHLPYAAKLVEKFPEQKFVLDHMAKPLIRDKLLSPWREGIQQLAFHPNVYCKLSGMVTEASWTGWRKKDFTPYLDVIFESFGPSRLMIGSDWPVCTV